MSFKQPVKTQPSQNSSSNFNSNSNSLPYYEPHTFTMPKGVSGPYKYADKLFGEDGWSLEVVELHQEYAEKNQTTSKWDVMITAVMLITLPQGATHQDIGCGFAENADTLGQGVQQARMKAMHDAVTRMMRYLEGAERQIAKGTTAFE